MMKTIVLLFTVMLSANISWAGNVKVLKTEYTGADFNLNGAYVTVNVQLLASNVATEECACFVLVKNGLWDGKDMTITKLSKLCKTMCVGEAELEPVSVSKTLDIPIAIPLEREYMTGQDTVLYMKTFVVDFNKKAIVAQGEMIRFNPDTQETREQIYSRAGQIAGSLFGGLLSNSRSDDSSYKTCPSCQGRGYIQNPDHLCSRCDGKGKVFKDIWDRGMDEYRESQKKQGSKNKKQQKEKEDSDIYGLFDSLFGF